MAKSPEEMMAAMIENLGQTTGKPIAEWLKIVKASKLEKHGEIVKLLKSMYGVTHGYANAIAHRALKSSSGEMTAAGEDLVGAHYSGAKAALRPIYDALAGMIRKFGADIDFAPKKAYVSVRRRKQFAIIQPSTATRVDIGINLKGVPPRGRLEPSGSFNAMVTHRVRVENASDVNVELEGWLKQAYDTA
jgi:Domain of unknown function (DUF5655)/Domain of unknown function (DUF4287)